MCHFISWIEMPDSEILFLDDDKLATKDRRNLDKRDIIGHGAIREFYQLNNKIGTNKECTDFNNPANFPEVIVEAIKAGKFSKFGVPKGILLKTIESKAWKEWEKTLAWRKYKNKY